MKKFLICLKWLFIAMFGVVIITLLMCLIPNQIISVMLGFILGLINGFTCMTLCIMELY